MRLYDSKLSGNAWKVRLLLNHLGLKFTRETLVLPEGRQKQPDFLAKNPLARIPVLELDDGSCLYESNAILCHLAEGTPYLPAPGLDRSRVLQWMFYEQADVLKPLARARFWIGLMGREAEMAKEIAVWHEEGNRALAVLEGHLAGHDFLVAARYTIADIALYPYVALCEAGRFDLARYPAVKAWLGRVEAQPGWVPLVEA
jgi:glutathione S-transferase